MVNMIPITCYKCGNHFDTDKDEMEVYLKYPETDPDVLYDILSLKPTAYLKVYCPICKSANYINE